MRSVDCPQGSVHSNALLGLLRREQPVVLLSETPGPEVVHFLLQTGELRGRSGEVQVAALTEVAVYAFLGDHAPHFPDGIEHRSVLGYGTLAIRVLGQFVKGSGEQVSAPPAVSSRWSKPCYLFLHHSDPQRRICFLEIIGSPQPCEARTDYGDVNLRRSRKRWARIPFITCRVMPHADVPVVRHAVFPLVRSSASSRSSIRSAGSSMPKESRTVLSLIPARIRAFSGIEAWLMVQGCSASDSTPPRDSAMAK